MSRPTNTRNAPAPQAAQGAPGQARAALPPLEGPALWLLTLALPLATFMQVLDTTIANVAIPTIAGKLGTSSTQGTWVITSYAVANAIALPLTGRLARRFGEVRLFMASVLLFAAASFLCGIAWNLSSLVLFRIIQGAVAGPMMPLAQTLLLNNYPYAKRSMAIALWSMTVSVAPIFGPVLGGWISDNYHWGWIFFINVPLGVIVLVLVGRLLRGRESPRSRQPMSRIGLALLVLGVGAFQMMLDRGKELDWFNSPEIVSLACVAVVGLVLLAAWEMTDKDPIVDLRLFSSRNFSVGVICISLGMMVYLGTVVLMPLLLQTRFGYTATLAGLASAPVGILPVLLTPFIGRYANKVDLRLLITFGFLVFAGCMYMRTWFSPDVDFRFVVVPQFIQGIGLACFFVPITTLTFADLPPHKMAAAAGLFNCIRTLFGAVGTSVTTTLWERREALHHTNLAAHISPDNPLAMDALNTLQGLGMSAQQSAEYLARQITTQGFILSATEIFYLSTLVFLGMIGIIWFARSTKRKA